MNRLCDRTPAGVRRHFLQGILYTRLYRYRMERQGNNQNLRPYDNRKTSVYNFGDYSKRKRRKNLRKSLPYSKTCPPCRLPYTYRKARYCQYAEVMT